MKRMLVLVGALVLAGGVVLAQEGPATKEASTRPVVQVDPADKGAVAEAKGKDVVAEGVIAKAAWSNTGKVMRASFAGGGMMVIVFDRDRKALDQAFGGDVAAALDGAKVRVTGTVEEFRGGYEVKVSRAEQVTILEAGKGPVTAPATKRTRQAAEPAERE